MGSVRMISCLFFLFSFLCLFFSNLIFFFFFASRSSVAALQTAFDDFEEGSRYLPSLGILV